jgi:hypothetical protein
VVNHKNQAVFNDVVIHGSSLFNDRFFFTNYYFPLDLNAHVFLDYGKNIPAFTLRQGYGQHYKTLSRTPRVQTQIHQDMTIEHNITSPHL